MPQTGISRLRTFVSQTPGLSWLIDVWHVLHFNGSPQYWESRYQSGSTSGDGSYGELAEFKAAILNQFVAQNGISSVLELGCGDGNQLSLAKYPSYIGYDIAPTAVELCKKRFAGDSSKQFYVYTPSNYVPIRCELALSLDVMYHLVESKIFESHVRHLFDSATQYVIVYSSNEKKYPSYPAAHVKYREVTREIPRLVSGWSLMQTIKNRYPYDFSTGKGSLADFFIYKKVQ